MTTDSYKSNGNIISSSILVLAFFSYFGLFEFTVIPYPVRVLSSAIMCALMAVMIITRIIYHPVQTIKMNFSTPILLLIFGVLPSYFIANYYYNQSVFLSLYANKMIWFYLLYFYVHFFKISTKFILKLIILTGLFAVVLFYIQYIIYPTRIMDIYIFEDRGTFRMFVPGMICAIVAYFYFLNQFFEKNRLIFLIICIICLSIYVLQGTRGYIFTLFFLTIVFLLVTNRIKSKFLIIFSIIVATFTVFAIFQNIFLELTRVSTSQANSLSSNIRIKSARYFLTDFMPGFSAYIFGSSNAAPGTIYSEKFMFNALKYGYYISDIGVIGDYVKYGLVFTLAGLYLLFKSIFYKISSKYSFLKYYIIAQCFTLLTGYGIFGGVDVIIVLILYVFDVDRFERLQETLQPTENKLNPS